MSSLLNDDDYQQILNRRFKRPDTKFLKAVVTPLSENVEGFLGEHYKLEVTYEIDGEQKVEYFFIKTKPIKNQTQRDMADEANMYGSEIFLYDFLFHEFEKYGFDTSFSPKCYYSIPEETLVMEDMATQDFSIPERGKIFNLEQCKCALKSLAYLHAAGIMYEEVKSKELGRRFRLNEEYQEISKERFYTQLTDFRNVAGEEWVKISIDMLCELIEFLPETEEYKSVFKKRLLEKEIGKIFVEKTNLKKTCTHGDLWSNNMLFKTENGVAKHCSLVDYQMARYFYPAYDIILFLQSNVDTEFRKKHLTELCDFYYTTLSVILSKHAFNIVDYYPKDDFKRSLEMVEFEVMLQASSVHALVRLPTELLNKHVNDGSDSMTKLICDDRISMSLNAFKKDEDYRKIMTEDLYELHDCLFKV